MGNSNLHQNKGFDASVKLLIQKKKSVGLIGWIRSCGRVGCSGWLTAVGLVRKVGIG